MLIILTNMPTSQPSLLAYSAPSATAGDSTSAKIGRRSPLFLLPAFVPPGCNALHRTMAGGNRTWYDAPSTLANLGQAGRRTFSCTHVRARCQCSDRSQRKFASGRGVRFFELLAILPQHYGFVAICLAISLPPHTITCSNSSTPSPLSIASTRHLPAEIAQRKSRGQPCQLNPWHRLESGANTPTCCRVFHAAAIWSTLTVFTPVPLGTGQDPIVLTREINHILNGFWWTLKRDGVAVVQDTPPYDIHHHHPSLHGLGACAQIQ